MRRYTSCLGIVMLFAGVDASRAALPKPISDEEIRQAAVTEFPEYFELLSIPSDSVVPADIQKNADFLVAAFTKRGFHAKTLENRGRPLVFADLRALIAPMVPSSFEAKMPATSGLVLIMSCAMRFASWALLL